MTYRVYDISVGQIKDPMNAPIDECHTRQIEAMSFDGAAAVWVEEQSGSWGGNYEVGTLLVVDSSGFRVMREYVYELVSKISIKDA